MAALNCCRYELLLPVSSQPGDRMIRVGRHMSCNVKQLFLHIILAQAACVCHPRWRLQCVAGHCYYQLLLFFLLFLPLLLLTHFGETPEAENLFPLIIWLSVSELRVSLRQRWPVTSGCMCMLHGFPIIGSWLCQNNLQEVQL